MERAENRESSHPCVLTTLEFPKVLPQERMVANVDV